MKIFFCKKKLADPKLQSRFFTICLTTLILTIAISQLAILGRNKIVRTVSQNSQNVFSGIVLSIDSGADKDIKILLDGEEKFSFGSDTVNIPATGDCVIEVYNPSSSAVRISIKDISSDVKLLANGNNFSCPKGISYICKLIKER